MGCRHKLVVDRLEDLVDEGSWSHERNVYRFPESGTCFLSKQRVSTFYHDYLGLVGLVGNLLPVAQLILLVVEQLLNPIPLSNHVSRKSLEEVEVTHILSRI